MAKIVKADKYRSSTFVNKDDDRIRVVLDMTLNEWYRLKKEIRDEG